MRARNGRAETAALKASLDGLQVGRHMRCNSTKPTKDLDEKTSGHAGLETTRLVRLGNPLVVSGV